jgi:hypothetical protein
MPPLLKLKKRQIVRSGAVTMAPSDCRHRADRGPRWRGVQAAAATPLMSAHIANARPLAARYSPAVTWPRRRWHRLLIPSWAERKRWAWPANLNRFLCRSRRRVAGPEPSRARGSDGTRDPQRTRRGTSSLGWCEFSALLLRPLCYRCCDHDARRGRRPATREGPKVCGLPAGGRWIRTLGPPRSGVRTATSA